MGVNRLFIPQEILDRWVDEGRATVEEGRLSLADEEGSYTLQPASHFLRESTGDKDPHDLVGRVKDQSTLEGMGAEAYVCSVLYNENAYDVVPGFVATPAAPEPRAGRTEDAAGAAEPAAADASLAEALVDSASVSEHPVGTPRPRSNREDSQELAELLLKHLK